MNKATFLVLPALLAIFSLTVISSGMFASAQFQERDIDLECRDGMVMVYREISSSYVCVDMDTAERWAQLGLAVIISQPEEEPAEEATRTEDADKETEKAPMEKETEMKEQDKEAEMKDSEKEMKETSDVRIMFVQTASSGTFVEMGDSYVLTLNDVSPQTVFFSDRPDRIAGHIDTGDFIEEWSAGSDSFADDPPNAAVTLLAAENSENVMIVELMNPVYDADSMTLQYDAVVLEESSNGQFTATTGELIPESFEGVSVFIDHSAGAHICALGVCVSVGGSVN